MKKTMLVLALLALRSPIVAWASGIDITNKYGTVTILNSGITTTGSELMSFDRIQAPQHHSLGTVSFGTGALATGSIWTGGTFSSTGSYFDVVGRGLYGEPRGAIFTGVFIGPINWTIVQQSGRNFVEWELSGMIRGTTWKGRLINGTTVQYIDTYKNQEIVDHKGNIGLGQMHPNTPEPSTLVLLGTGLIAMTGALRRK